MILADGTGHVPEEMGLMKNLPVSAQLYVTAVVTAGAALLVTLFPVGVLDAPIPFIVLAVLSALTAVFKVSLPLARSESTLSVSYAVDFTALLLLGANPTMLIAATSALSQCTFRTKTRTPLHRTLFSMACLVLAVQAAGFVYRALGGIPGEPTVTTLVRSVVAMVLVYFFVNTGLVATAIALSTRQRVQQVWMESFLYNVPGYFVGAGAATFVALVVPRSALWIVPVAVVPLYLTYRSYQIYSERLHAEKRQVEQMSNIHLATVEALARAIDAKHQMSPGHLHRMQVYAAGLARAIGMPDNEIHGVKTAALLHDIGNVAVPEYILSKPGRLTKEEFERIKAHPQVGADIVEVVPFPYPVAPLIRNHHERWDGTGYPRGLKGEQIPLGARILTIVDYFDALMSKRPHHEPISATDAIDVLGREAGQALDPKLLQTFLAVFPNLMDAARAGQADRSNRHGDSLLVESQPTDDRSALAIASPTVFDDIARTHQEIYVLYEIAQAMGSSLGVSETLLLISSKMTRLVPFSCCALFLYDAEAKSLTCRSASGTDAELLQDLTVASGAGANGLVAQNGKSLLNARPAADLEAAGLDSTITTSLQSALVCPLTSDDRFIGTLAVYHKEADFYGMEHLRLLERIATQAAAVVNNSIMFEQTEKDSLTDALTGLPNRRSLFLHLTNELTRARRLGTQVSLLVIDLDDFKQINDQYGHDVGDRALCAVASTLRSEIRPYDLCVRYAGDEFVIVLSGVSGVELQNRREGLRAAIERVPFTTSDQREIPVGCSVGEAVFPHDGEGSDVLFAVADRRMYKDKSERKRLKEERAASQREHQETTPAEPAPPFTLHRGGRAAV